MLFIYVELYGIGIDGACLVIETNVQSLMLIIPIDKPQQKGPPVHI